MYRAPNWGLLLSAALRFRSNKPFRFRLLAHARQHHIPRGSVLTLFDCVLDLTGEPTITDLARASAQFRRRHWRILAALIADCLATTTSA